MRSSLSNFYLGRQLSTFVQRTAPFSSTAATVATHDQLRQKIKSLNSQESPMTHQKFTGRKRFYKQVGVQEIAAKDFRVTLDGRLLRTPARNPLQLPNKNLAVAIAAEWDMQTDHNRGIEPVTMQLMSLASTAIDQVQFDRETAIATCMKYLPTDSALFFTTESDRVLLTKQRKHLSPVIRWVSRQLRTEIPTTTDMAGRIQHSEQTVQAFQNMLENMDNFTLTCMQKVVSECKSIVLATAYLGRYLTLEQIKAASRIEEEFQVEIWGLVEGGHDMDRLNNSISLSSVSVFMSLYSPSAGIFGGAGVKA